MAFNELSSIESGNLNLKHSIMADKVKEHRLRRIF